MHVSGRVSCGILLSSGFNVIGEIGGGWIARSWVARLRFLFKQSCSSLLNHQRNAILWIAANPDCFHGCECVQIVQKEFLLKQGITMLCCAWAPVDPRSLIQGDYMALRYDLPDFLQEASLPRNGQVVVRSG